MPGTNVHLPCFPWPSLHGHPKESSTLLPEREVAWWNTTKDSWPGSQGLPWLLAVSLSLNVSLNPQSGKRGKPRLPLQSWDGDRL